MRLYILSLQGRGLSAQDLLKGMIFSEGCCGSGLTGALDRGGASFNAENWVHFPHDALGRKIRGGSFYGRAEALRPTSSMATPSTAARSWPGAIRTGSRKLGKP